MTCSSIRGFLLILVITLFCAVPPLDAFNPHLELALDSEWLDQNGIEIKHATDKGLRHVLVRVTSKKGLPLKARLEGYDPDDPGERIPRKKLLYTSRLDGGRNASSDFCCC